MTPLLFNRHVPAPSGTGTTLQWGDMRALTDAASLEFVPLGACHGRDASDFYVNKGKNLAVDRARAMCRTCPVAPECLAWALAHELGGVWGGASPKERRAMRKRIGVQVSVPETTVGRVA